MSVFVLVPGGWHGAWAYEPVTARLRRCGHDARPLTLTGLGERAQLLTGATNLDTHIEDVVAVLESDPLDSVVLCGHSYGGMVITGVAARVPDRIARLVYIDAYVPSHGDSCWTLTTEAFRRLFVQGAAADGWSVAPPPGLDARATPHPLASLLQQIRLHGSPEPAIQREFVYLSRWHGTPFALTHERLSRDPCWRVHVLPTGHNVIREAPERIVEILTAPVERM